MDARITKQRLANMLSYDWLKIICVVLAAVFAFYILFVMIATRATDGQKFYVYAYDGVNAGTDFNRLDTTLFDKKVFSYEILDAGSEVFNNEGMYGSAVYTARRSSGEGRVLFLNNHRETAEEPSSFENFIEYNLNAKDSPAESLDVFLDPEAYLKSCKEYLARFFGDKLNEAEPNENETRKVFSERNGKDKRFRTPAKKEEGVALEKERLKKLKEDYLTVSAGIESGLLPYADYTTEIKTHRAGFRMEALNLNSLVFYNVKKDGEETESKDCKDIVLCVFNNGTREGDLKFESVNFIAYLLRNYGSTE